MNISYKDFKAIEKFISNPKNEWIVKLLPNSTFIKKDDVIYITPESDSVSEVYALEERATELDKEIIDFMKFVCKKYEREITIFFDEKSHVLYAKHVRNTSKYGYTSFSTDELEKLITRDNYKDVIETILSWLCSSDYLDFLISEYKSESNSDSEFL